MTIITQKTAFYVDQIEQLPCHFCFELQVRFVFGKDAQRHANKGAQQMRNTTWVLARVHAIQLFLALFRHIKMFIRVNINFTSLNLSNNWLKEEDPVALGLN